MLMGKFSDLMNMKIYLKRLVNLSHFFREIPEHFFVDWMNLLMIIDFAGDIYQD